MATHWYSVVLSTLSAVNPPLYPNAGGNTNNLLEWSVDWDRVFRDITTQTQCKVFAKLVSKKGAYAWDTNVGTVRCINGLYSSYTSSVNGIVLATISTQIIPNDATNCVLYADSTLQMITQTIQIPKGVNKVSILLSNLTETATIASVADFELLLFFEVQQN